MWNTILACLLLAITIGTNCNADIGIDIGGYPKHRPDHQLHLPSSSEGSDSSISGYPKITPDNPLQLPSGSADQNTYDRIPVTEQTDDEAHEHHHHHHHHDHHHNHGEDGKYNPHDDGTGWDIRKSIPGEPGRDYPTYDSVPSTGFSCAEKSPGYYADLGARCQVFRVCTTGSVNTFNSFLCPNGSLFNQAILTCDWWQNVDCQASEKFYDKNNAIGKMPEGVQLQYEIKKMLEAPKFNPHYQTQQQFISNNQIPVDFQNFRPPQTSTIRYYSTPIVTSTPKVTLGVITTTFKPFITTQTGSNVYTPVYGQQNQQQIVVPSVQYESPDLPNPQPTIKPIYGIPSHHQVGHGLTVTKEHSKFITQNEKTTHIVHTPNNGPQKISLLHASNGHHNVQGLHTSGQHDYKVHDEGDVNNHGVTETVTGNQNIATQQFGFQNTQGNKLFESQNGGGVTQATIGGQNIGTQQFGFQKTPGNQLFVSQNGGQQGAQQNVGIQNFGQQTTQTQGNQQLFVSQQYEIPQSIQQYTYPEIQTGIQKTNNQQFVSQQYGVPQIGVQKFTYPEPNNVPKVEIQTTESQPFLSQSDEIQGTTVSTPALDSLVAISTPKPVTEVSKEQATQEVDKIQTQVSKEEAQAAINKLQAEFQQTLSQQAQQQAVLEQQLKAQQQALLEQQLKANQQKTIEQQNLLRFGLNKIDVRFKQDNQNQPQKLNQNLEVPAIGNNQQNLGLSGFRSQNTQEGFKNPGQNAGVSFGGTFGLVGFDTKDFGNDKVESGDFSDFSRIVNEAHTSALANFEKQTAQILQQNQNFPAQNYQSQTHYPQNYQNQNLQPQTFQVQNFPGVDANNPNYHQQNYQNYNYHTKNNNENINIEQFKNGASNQYQGESVSHHNNGHSHTSFTGHNLAFKESTKVDIIPSLGFHLNDQLGQNSYVSALLRGLVQDKDSSPSGSIGGNGFLPTDSRYSSYQGPSSYLAPQASVQRLPSDSSHHGYQR